MEETRTAKPRTVSYKPDKKDNDARRRKTIEELFQNYRGGFSPSEIDWGKPRGREIW